MIFGFAQGEELSEHTASMPAILQFIRGEMHDAVWGGDERLIVISSELSHYLGAKRLLLGSVAERVLRHSHCPVLVLRQTA